ncbi:MAG TPA: sugar phosphate isomerase/epimerase family protein [Terriglobales bacterium]|nr:sugar phosphate isomerase/epimerase family protein [Terriglobales bacterium]
MLRAMSTYVFVKDRLHPGLLDKLAQGGAQAIEIFAARGHFDYTSKQHIKEIAAWFQHSGVAFQSMHSPMFCDTEWGRSGAPPINPLEKDRGRRIEAMDEIKRALEVAEIAPFKFLVQHMGNGGEEWDEAKFEAGLTTLEHIQAFAKALGVTILVENIPNEFSTAEKLLEFQHNVPGVGVCFDVGHAHLADGIEPTFDRLSRHIRSTHLHDNLHDRDSHLWPGKGNIDWPLAMRLLRSAPQSPALLLEIDGTDQDVVQGMKDTWSRLEQATAVAANN